jgi:4-hydroxybenzoate polyprenyltransferase
MRRSTSSERALPLAPSGVRASESLPPPSSVEPLPPLASDPAPPEPIWLSHPAGPGPRRTIPLTLLAVLEALRPYQWLKNALVFVPLAAAHRLGELPLAAAAARMFVAYSLCASAVYLLNDLLDVAADRMHPHKQWRPLASGRLPRGLALVLVPLLLAAALATSAPLGLGCIGVLGLYFVLMTAYSLRLKAVVLLDSLILASGYALRVLAGGFAVHIRPSARLLAFCIFLFFSLALLKRYAELALLKRRDGPSAHARSYLLEDQELVLVLGGSSGILSVLVLALYMSTGNIERLYSRSELIWGTSVLLLYWVSYMWLTAHRGRMTDDPLVFAIKDRLSLALIALMGVTAWLAV